jgi:hypothetical protein
VVFPSILSCDHFASECCGIPFDLQFIIRIMYLLISNSINISRFHLYKENKDTQEALGVIGKMLGVQVLVMLLRLIKLLCNVPLLICRIHHVPH